MEGAKLTCGLEVEQVIRRSAVVMLLCGGSAGCGPWQRVGSESRPQPGVTVTRMFDASSVYRSMGFLVGAPPVSFVGSVHYFKAGAGDSTLALCALSLANHALSFRRDGNEFVAEYR